MKQQQCARVRTARWWRGGIVVVALAGVGTGVLGGPVAGAATGHQSTGHQSAGHQSTGHQPAAKHQPKSHQPAKNQPASVAAKTSPALIVAKQSRSEVTELHDLAVSAGRSAGLPPGAIPASARGVAATFRSELATVKVLHPKTSSTNGVLVRSLTSYLGLATTLANSKAPAGKPLPNSYFTNLRATDQHWRQAMKSLGKSTHENLLAGMPALLFPKHSA